MKFSKTFIKFLFLLLTLFGYFLYISYKFGLNQGSLATMLSWSFFVLCTPVADGGFLIDFPLTLITNIKMIYLEIIPWAMAILINLYAYFFIPKIYETTALLRLFKKILSQPIPFWGIILISGFGTFISLNLGDGIISKIKTRNIRLKSKFIFSSIIFVASITLYAVLLKKFGIELNG